MKEKDGSARAAVWLAAGLRIADEVAATAVWANELCAFHGAKPGESLTAPPRFGSLGFDLYEGSAGIARFLGRAAALSGAAPLRDTALGAIRHALGAATGWPLFTGALGVGVTALELAEVLDAPELVSPATQCIEQASATACRDGAPYDLLVGTAGVVVGLVAAQRHDLDGGWMERAYELGRGLLAVSVADGPGDAEAAPLSWPLSPGAAERLCGLAHGASGVALAFEALARHAPAGAPWRQYARRARAFERAHYSAQAGSWADLRSLPTGAPPPFPYMWCHGAIGVTAERLSANPDDLMARADAVGGLAGTAAHVARLLAGPVGAGADDVVNGSLCHGLAGAIDLFVDACQVSGDTSWMALAGELADLMLNDARRAGGWRSGIRGGWSTPGLMLGLSGIGWALLRVADPDRVPSGWRVGPAATS
jgi:lantibiotic modifying enzyme